MAQLFKLTGEQLQSLLGTFKSEFPTGVISRTGFKRIFTAFLRSNTIKTVLSGAEVDGLLDRLFTIFDRDHNEIVDSRELVTGLSMLCDDTSQNRIRMAFEVYDQNNDGVITLDEMIQYLSSVFTVMNETNSSLFDRSAVSPEELAEITARRCFEEADVNDDGILSFEEFQAWFSAPPSSPAASGAASGEGHGARSGPFLQLQEIRQQTGLGTLSATKVFDALKAESTNGTFTQSAFVASIIKVLRKHDRLPVDATESQRLRGVLRQLFSIMDIDGNGRLDAAELGSGLSVLCGGSRDEKVAATFDLFDTDGNGEISLSEMTTYLVSVFKVIYAAQPDVAASLGATPEHLGRVTAEECFRLADVDRDGVISFEEFKDYYNDGLPLLPQLGAASGVTSALPNWLAEARRLTRLQDQPVMDVMKVFAAQSDPTTGLLTRKAFATAFRTFIQHPVSTEEQGSVRRLLSDLFDAFDSDGNGVVDFNELVLGLNVLCGSSPEERARAVFSLYDTDGDGCMSKDEMLEYLRAVFTVLYTSDPSMQSKVGVTASELAEATVDKCFQDVDTNSDGKVSLEEFLAWQATGMEVEVEAQAPPAPSTLSAAKTLTGLGSVHVSDAARVFAGFASGGQLDASAFVSAFDHIGAARNVPRSAARMDALRTLFEAFDTDGSGTLDFSELFAGLSVLCGGYAVDKLQVAFNLFDFNGDGFITPEELQAYLAAVYRVMFVAKPHVAAALRVSPDDLATATALDCLREADTDRDGRLSFSEFARFYARSAGLVPSAQAPPAPSAPVDVSAARDILTLGRHPVATVVGRVGDHCDAQGRLTHDAFLAAFEQFVAPGVRVEDAVDVLNALYDLFDTDSDGTVSAAELSAGLSVLCAGSGGDKLEAVFNTYDLDHDGTVSFGEMRAYLTSVFTVLFATQPGTAERMGVSPAKLAHATATQCFTDADQNRDGKLTLAEFVAWYGSSEPRTQAVAGLVGAATGRGAAPAARAPPAASASVGDFKRLAGLSHLAVGDVLSHFASFADRESRLSRRAFNAAFAAVGIPPNATPAERQACREARATLFDVFDTNGDGEVSFQELASGLSVVCGGTSTDKAEAAFATLDLNGDGWVTPDEMQTYMTSVFRVMYASEPGTEESVGMSAEELAAATTAQCFQEADTDGDGRLTLEEFKAWSDPTVASPQRTSAAPGGTPAAPDVRRSVVDAGAAMPAGMTLAEARRLTGLGDADIDVVLNKFARFCLQDGTLNWTGFQAAMRSFQAATGTGLTAAEARRSQIVLRNLFALFDANGDGRVDFRELSAGLSALAGGSTAEKVSSIFALYDFDGNGFIDVEEMQSYLTSVFTVLFATQPGTGDRLGVTPDALAYATTTECFEQADTDGDGCISREEFFKWYESPLGVGGGATGGDTTTRDLVSTAAARPAWLTLPEVRRLLQLSDVPLDVVANTFARFSDAKGRLNRAGFNAAFAKFLQPQRGEDVARTQLVLTHLFDLFDADGSGYVDFTECASGLSVLCGGTRDGKIEVAFNLFDYNQDGYVSRDEVEIFLNSVFKVLYAAHDSASSSGATPEELARATAFQCFEDADLNHDGRLSLEEFKRWYQPGAAPGATSANARNAMFAAAVATPQWLSLAAVKEILGLGNRTVADVAAQFASATDGDGLLTRGAFNRVFAGLVPAGTDPERLRFVLAHLFDMMDTDGNGSVDFAELTSGLSVLCSGDRAERIRAAFDLYDYNGDGHISIDEMQTFLTSVFKVLYATQPGVRERMGVSPQELAAVTTQQCFADADKDGDELLTWEEFREWYERANPGGDAVREAVLQAGDSAKPTWVSLPEIKRLTNLQNFEVEFVMEKFATQANEDGLLSRRGFNAAFQEFVKPQTAEDAQRTRLVLTHLFDLFDADSNGFVDFRELASGLSVFCGGSRDTRIASAFALYDFNGDGYISLDEMQMYLEAVFTVLYESEAGTEARLGASAKELAAATALQCFRDADLDKDGRLNFTEFKAWYTGNIGHDDGGVRDRVVGLAAEPPSWVSMGEVKRLTNLGSYSVADVMTLFARVADDDGLIGRSDFNRVFASLVDTSNMNERDRERSALVLSRLFDIFDKDGNGACDFSELSSGLSVLCGGSQTDKVRASFEAFDADGDGYIDLEEMTTYLASVFRVLFEMSPETADAVQATPDEMAAATAQQAFEEADADGDGRISFEEFAVWYQSDSRTNTNRLAAAATSFPTEQAASGQSGSPSGTTGQALANVRQMLRLDRIPLSHLLEVFTTMADPAGNLDLANFKACMQHLQAAAGADAKELKTTLPLVHRLHELFDTDRNGLVSREEIAAGLSVLCNATEEDKVASAFSLYDTNGDGFIDLTEMANYLTSVYRVIYDTVPGTEESVGVSPEVLGLVTAEQCFAEADLNHDGKLSIDEFRRWFALNAGGLPHGPESPDRARATQAVVDRSQAHSAQPTARLVRQKLGLGQFDIQEVFDSFQEQSTDGVLTYVGFMRAFALLVHLSGRSMSDQGVTELVEDLFTVFDRDGNGVVSYDELAAGLSVFCSGTTDAKVESAFALYDADGDGFVSLEEMDRYLRSVFRIMYHLNPAFAAQNGVSVEDLARETALRAFEDCSSEKMSFEDFRAWYTAGQ